MKKPSLKKQDGGTVSLAIQVSALLQAVLHAPPRRMMLWDFFTGLDKMRPIVASLGSRPKR